MDFVFHDRMSEFLKSTALSPPRREGHGFDLLDVVVVDPNAKDPAKMIIPTDTNLCHNFTREKLHHRHTFSESFGKNEQRVSDETFELNDELKAAIGAKGVDVSTHGSLLSKAHVNLVITDERTESVSGVVIPRLERMVKDCFATIVKGAAKYNMTTKCPWYNYYSGTCKRTVYYLAVITRTYHGSISIEEAESNGFAAGVGAKVQGIFSALTDMRHSESNSLSSSSEGIVGVQLLCFPFRKGAEPGTYYFLEPTSVKYMDEHEREWLQNAHKRRSWKLLEKQEEGYMDISRRRLSNFKETVTTAVTRVREEVASKGHDINLIKSLGLLLVVTLLLIPILASVSSNSPTFHSNLVKFGPRQFYLMQQALLQGLEDFLRFAMTAAFST